MQVKTSAPQNTADRRKTDRDKFWSYCNRAKGAAAATARARALPYDIDAYAIDELLVGQKWCCAVSGIPLDPTNPTDFRLNPFGPSLDRIVPKLGYVRGNVRVVCNMANFAINEWGLETLEKFMNAVRERAGRTKWNR